MIGTKSSSIGKRVHDVTWKTKWDDKIRTDLKQIWREDMDSIYVIQDTNRWKAFLKTVMTVEVS
jgi:hypothetical protein